MKKRGPWNDRFYKYCLVYCNISAIFGPNFAFLKAKKIGLASPFESELSSPSRVRVSEKGPSLQVRAQSPRLGSTPMGKRQLFTVLPDLAQGASGPPSRAFPKCLRALREKPKIWCIRRIEKFYYIKKFFLDIFQNYF